MEEESKRTYNMEEEDKRGRTCDGRMQRVVVVREREEMITVESSGMMHDIQCKHSTMESLFN